MSIGVSAAHRYGVVPRWLDPTVGSKWGCSKGSMGRTIVDCQVIIINIIVVLVPRVVLKVIRVGFTIFKFVGKGFHLWQLCLRVLSN